MVRRANATELLLHVLDEAYGKSAWHGPNLRSSLRGVTARLASWRPGAGRHNIRELVLHAAYWKHLVRRRLKGGRRSAFPIPGHNFFRLPDPSERTWRAERALLEREHRALRQAVAAYPASRLARKLPGASRRTPIREVFGIALHDVYHTGQIQTLKVLFRQRRTR
jgi:hypothetical protein